MTYLGIDPGLSGALAVLHADGTVLLHDTPTRKASRGHAYLPADMAELLRPYAGQAFAVLEVVSAPRVGRGESAGNGSAALKIGHGLGLWEGMLVAFGIPYEAALPAVWKKSFSLVGQDKKASRARACELFPGAAAELGKRRADYAEALLLAYFGKLRHGRAR